MKGKSHRKKSSGKENRGTQVKVDTVMREFREGTLKSSDGEKVTKHSQAIAIALSEAEPEKANA
ncbi:hypothetical protein LCGC14_1959750 [marine sediment metagenome]|uniref:Uncharacterized protein n=1 Tax=marine sediment metagenome TaxID=412755 RepID=A0A0F9FF65_9ZZZZ